MNRTANRLGWFALATLWVAGTILTVLFVGALLHDLQNIGVYQ